MEKLDIFQSRFGKIDKFGWWYLTLRQWMQTARPQCYSVKIYLDEIDKLENYESIFP